MHVESPTIGKPECRNHCIEERASMEILSCKDVAFKPYGRVVDGYDVTDLLNKLEKTL